MADITITVPDTILPEVVDALCAVGDWKTEDGNRNAFAKQVIIRWMKRVTTNARVKAQSDAAAAAANASATTDLTNIV